MNKIAPKTMEDVASEYSISKEARQKIKHSNAKGLLLCARKCNSNGKEYRVRYQKNEISISIYDLHGKLESARYFMHTEQGELLKLAKKYRTFKLEWISTEALKVLAECTS